MGISARCFCCDNTTLRRNRVDERQQLRDATGVCTGPDCDDWNAADVYEDVMLGTRTRAILGVRASFSPAPTARTDDESTAAYERSSWPVARSLSSSNSCSRSRTPAFCQSSPASRARAEAQPGRQVVPTDAFPEHEQDAVQRHAIQHTRTPRIALRARLHDRQQGFDQFPPLAVNDRRFYPGPRCSGTQG